MRSYGFILTIPFKYESKIITIKYLKSLFDKYDYFVFQLEQGDNTGYKHYQLYLENETQIRFETLKNLIPFAHIEQREGTKKQAYDYCTKVDTRLHGPFEFGSRPIFNDKSKKNGLKEEFIKSISLGASDRELLLQFPSIFTKKYANEIRDVLGVDLYLDNRDVKVSYIYGKAGVGKSSYVRRLYKPRDIYVVSDYDRDPFGGYKGQKCIIFEEYRNNFPLSMFLQYLDIYPVELPCRYSNRQALYTDVYIISNWSLDNQYSNLDPCDRLALLRRITNRIEIDTDYIYRQVFKNNVFIKKDWIFNPLSERYDYLKGCCSLDENIYSAFKD